jgi:hypothetical protein
VPGARRGAIPPLQGRCGELCRVVRSAVLELPQRLLRPAAEDRSPNR